MSDNLPIGAELCSPSKRQGESPITINPKYARSRRSEGLEKAGRMVTKYVNAIESRGGIESLIKPTKLKGIDKKKLKKMQKKAQV